MTRGRGRAGRRGLVVGLVGALLLPLTPLSAAARPTPAATTETTATPTTAADASPAARVAAAPDVEPSTSLPTTAAGSSDAAATAESAGPASAESAPTTDPAAPSSAPVTSAAAPSGDGTGQDGTGQPAAEPSSAPDARPETDAEPEPDARPDTEPGPGDVTAAAVAIDPSLPASQVGLTKSTNLGDPATVQPGDSFTYQLSANCSGLTAGCVDAEIVDVLPTGLDVVEIDPSIPGRTVTYDEATRRLTVRYGEALVTPADRTGLPAGSTRNFFLTVRLPATTPLGDGATITNTGELSAANAAPATAGTDVRVTVTPIVRPVATKTWTPNSVVAESGAVTTVDLGIRNASSAGTTIDRLTLTDATVATYDAVDVTGLTVTGWPAGADRATLAVCTVVGRACTDGEYQIGAPQTGSLPLSLAPPDRVALDAVTGLRIVFTAADGSALPVDQTGGTVQMTTRLRDTVRSTGAPLRPTTAQTVTNCATPSAAAGQAPPTVGPDACAGLQIQPNLVLLTPAKSFFADANNDFSPGDGRIVVGQNSPASAVVTITNRSAFAIRTLTVTDPDPLQPGEFDKFDASDYRVLLPTGATSATVTVTCRTGPSPAPLTVTGNQNKAPSGCQGPIGSLSVTFTGVDGTGQPSIASGSVATVGLTGAMNGLIDASDVPSPSDPGAGISNCAAFDGSTDGDVRGSAAGAVCRTLPAENPRVDGGGTKTVSQTSVPFGQPVSFTLTVRNGGNVPLAAPGVVDPQVDAAGVPSTDPAVSPFGRLRITGVTTNRTGGFSGPVIVEVYDPQAATWVAYPASDAVLARATGVRARTTATVALGQGFTATVTTQMREQTAAGVPLANCAATIGADGTVYPGLTGFCSPQFITGDPVAAASLNKFIVPASVPRRIPGLTPPTASVRIPVANTGNVSLRRLQVVDTDADFFDAVDFVRVEGVNRPPGANRTQLDVCTSAPDCAAGTFVLGTPTGSTPGLPAGVGADQVRGVRVTFTNSDTTTTGYLLTPGQNLPGGGSCPNASVCFSVSPRATLRSNGATPIPGTLADTVTGGLESPLQPPGTLQPIPPQTASLAITDGSPKLAITKTPNSTVSPGDPAPFTLRVVNTGTAFVPDLRIVDPIPDGLVFDDTFVGDGGQPFRVVESSVPTGADPWPAPTFTPTVTGDRVTGVAFAFPGYRVAPTSVIALQIQVKLAPGVAANTRIPNTAGTSSPATGLACDGTFVVDGGLGPGTWCTASATVTSRGGAAFDARKWVAGTPELGWYNTATKARVPVGGTGCPALTVAERTYTLYPCIALVNPGDRFDYVLKFVNAGTEPATEMRLIDRFPVQGDTGVILSQARGTQWANRPVLASAPTVLSATSPVAGTEVLYTDGQLCNLDLSLGQRGCPSSDWAAGYGAAATAFQMRLSFANPTLPPAAEVLIGFSMTTPLDVPQVSNPTIAWNSFAHAERTVRGSGTFVLPPTEPLQVGVATAYGRLELAKAIGDNPFDLAVATLPFTVNYSCTLTPVGGSAQVVATGSTTVTATTPVAVDGIPAGASCAVWESAGPGVPRSPGGSAADPIVVPITWDPANPAAASRATVTNDFPARTVVVAKQVTGPAAALVGTGPFSLELSCHYPDGSTADFPLTISGAGTQSVSVPVDADCELTERDGAGATSVTFDPADGEVSTSGADPVTVTATNHFAVGTLRLLKSLSGPGADQADRPFTFAVDCSFQRRPSVFTQSVTLTRPTGSTADVLSADVSGIPAGAICAVTETDSGGADVTPAPVGGVLIRPDGPDGSAGSPVTVSFDNPFSVGSLSLVKTVDGDAANQPWAAGPFIVQVTCQRTGTGPDGSPATVTVPLPNGGLFTVAGGSTTPVSRTLPIGTRCWAVETDAAGASSVSIDHGSPQTAVQVVLPPGGTAADAVVPPISITVTNTFAVGSLVVTKTLAGDAAGFAAGTPFTVTVSCTLPTGGGAIALPVRTVSFTGAGSAQLDGLPIGARCAVAETVTGEATSVAVDHGPADPVAIVAGAPATATVTNTFAAGLLAVSKTVRNGTAGPYAVTVSCRTAAGAAVPLSDLAANLLIRAGQTVTLAVPAGATCRVAEPNPPSGATVSYADSDGSTDGTVSVPAVAGGLVGATPTATVAITNTFPQNQGGGGSGGGGSGGSTGGGGSGGGGANGGTSGGSVTPSPLASTGVDVVGLLTAAAGVLLLGLVALWLGQSRSLRRTRRLRG